MFVFIIPTCIRNELHENQLKRCIESIRNYHDNTIYLINDSENIDDIVTNYTNVHIIQSKIKGSADQQVFKFILENNMASHYVIIQDSMFLNKKLENIDQVTNVKFLWHFTNHRFHWDKIIENQTEFNIINNINTHTDLIRYHLIKNYNEPFLSFALDWLINKNNWVGCFGNCCIITKKCVTYLNSQTNFANKFIFNNTNRERRMNESIFSLLCYYYFPDNYEDSYDGLYYDGITSNYYCGKDTGFDGLKYCCKNNYISKISFER